MVGEGFVTREAFGIFSRNLDRRIDALEAQRGGVSGGGGGGLSGYFRFLKDVPNSYSTYALRHVKVNTGETGLEFGEKITIDASGPSGGDNGDIWLQYGVPAVHALLSDTHSDTLADSVIAGDLIYGNSTPKWARKVKGADGQFLKMVSGLPDWAVHGLSYSDVGAAASGHNHAGVYEPVIAGGTSAQYWRGDKSFQTLNQAAVDGLTIADGPTFAHLHLSDLAAVTTPAESWIGPSSTAGIYFKGGNVGIGLVSPSARLHLKGGDVKLKMTDTEVLALTLGLASEVGGQLIDFGSNYSQLGDNNPGYAGGFFRIELRDQYADEFFNIKFIPAEQNETTPFKMSRTGDIVTTGKLTAVKSAVMNLTAYANNAAAVAGGLAAGDFYRTGGDPDLVCVVH